MDKAKEHTSLFSEPRPDADLKQIAMDLHDGKIFCDRQVNSPDDLSRVFMVIALGGFAGVPKEELKNIGLIFEYVDKAGTRSINGMPCFLSMQLLSQSDTIKMFGYYEEYKALKEKFQQVK